MIQNVTAELRDFGTAIVAWMSGSVPQDDEHFQSLDSILHPDFTYVRPSGEELDRDACLSHFRDVWGIHDDVRFRTEHVKLICSSATSVVVKYHEFEEVGETTYARLCTVVFLRSEEARNGLLWLRLHETRLQDESH